MKRLLTGALALAGLATVLVLPLGRNATAKQPLQDYRAGTAGFAIGQDGINVTFSSPMPSTAYSVVVQETNTAGYSPTSDCTYFNTAPQEKRRFEVQHKRCVDGVPVKLDVNIALDYPERIFSIKGLFGAV